MFIINNIKLIAYGVGALILALVVGHFYNLEKEHVTNGFVQGQTKLVADAKKKDETATNKIETKYQIVTKVEVQYVDRIVTKEVIKYKDRVVNRCQLDPEWVRIYNLSTEQAGTESSPAVATSPAADAGKTVDDAKALDVATRNNRVCVAEIEKLKALQEWAKQPLQDERK